MLSVIYAECHQWAFYADYAYVEWCYAVCHYADCNGRLLALLANTSLKQKWITVTNNLVYYGTELITTVKNYSYTP